jgi:putative two-component system response regulator
LLLKKKEKEMSDVSNSRQTILIADDSEMNRALLIDMLEDQFDIEEVEDGAQVVEALQERAATFSLLLLDIVMPKMDGYEVLAYMNKYHWIEDIPVIMISAETSPAYIERAYDLGVTDFISRPFDAAVVRRRVSNTMLLSAKQRKLINIVADQIFEKEKSDKLMISILSHIVEFRNGESGLHVLHINAITEMLLKCLVQKTDRYELSQSDINMIVIASALHDIGKISIPSEVLNKPGRLTAEEFEIMKQHSLVGAQMLDKLPDVQKEEALVKVAYEICRWHHERYDGGGYPDGLKGDDIPISAQVVAMADVYDALTSERCYKKAFTHEQAVEMILQGQCGVFNPLLLECLIECAPELKRELNGTVSSRQEKRDVQYLAEQMNNYNLPSMDWMIQQQEYERQQFHFLASTLDDPIFQYRKASSALNLNEQGQELLDLESAISNPLENPKVLEAIAPEDLKVLQEKIAETTPSKPTVSMDLQLTVRGETDWYRCVLSTIWLNKQDDIYAGMVGRIMNIQLEHEAEEQEREAFLKNVTKFSSHPVGSKKSEVFYSMSGIEAWLLLKQMQGIFDQARLVDVAVQREIVINKKGVVSYLPYSCYCAWEKEDRCQNCISAKCICGHDRQSKFEFINDELYYVQSKYVEVDGQQYAMELVNKITNDTILCGYGRQDLLDHIVGHNEKLYVDPVTGVYNRRYYEEQLCGRVQPNGVAMIDIDDFKAINDSHGHQTGDQALRMIAEEIKQCVRKSDIVVRYGGDEFVVIFQSIPEDVFRKKLHLIRDCVAALRLDDAPEMSFTLSVGGSYGEGRVAELLKTAEEQLYEEKREKER